MFSFFSLNTEQLFQRIFENMDLLLVFVSTAYVVFTYYNQIVLKASLMPILFPYISKRGNSLKFEIANYSSNPAYDVDIWLIGAYDKTIVSYKSLIYKKYVKENKINFKDTLFKDPFLKEKESDFYGIIERVTYYAFPPKTKCSFTPYFYKTPGSVYIVMQFRDTLGKNYLYQAWLFEEDSNFKKGYIKYSPLKSVGRIKMSFFKDWKSIAQIVRFTSFFHVFKLLCLDIVSQVRKRRWMCKETRDILKRTISSGHQKGAGKHYVSGEDKGKFSSTT